MTSQPVNEKLPPNYERLSNGTIGIRVRVNGRSRRKATGFSDLKSAMRVGEKFRRELLEEKQGIKPKKQAQIPTLRVWYETEYLPNYCGRGRNGKKKDPHAGSKAMPFVEAHGTLRLDEFTESLCVRWMRQRERTITKWKTLYSPATIRTEMLVLKAMFEPAVGLHIAVNPWKWKTIAFPKAPPRKRVLQEGDHQIQLLTGLSEKDRNAVLFILATGMRRAEFLGFRPCDFRGDQITVRAEVAKGGKERVIPAHPIAVEALTVQRRARGLALDSDELLWDYDYPEQLWKHIDATCRRLDLPHVSVHDLRRTLGSRMANSNQVPLHMVQEMLGHASIEVTREHYVVTDKTLLTRHVQHANLGLTAPAEIVSLADVSRKVSEA